MGAVSASCPSCSEHAQAGSATYVRNAESSSVVVCVCAGAGSAILSKEAAMACTVAVEEAVVEHYNRFYQLYSIF